MLVHQKKETSVTRNYPIGCASKGPCGIRLFSPLVVATWDYLIYFFFFSSPFSFCALLCAHIWRKRYRRFDEFCGACSASPLALPKWMLKIDRVAWFKFCSSMRKDQRGGKTSYILKGENAVEVEAHCIVKTGESASTLHEDRYSNNVVEGTRSITCFPYECISPGVHLSLC